MNRTLKDANASILLVIICFVAYTLIGFSRSAYTAAIAGIISDGIFSKTAAGTISSSFYITYSLSQIIGSFYVDKISPFKVIAFGLIGTIIANVFMAQFPTFTVIIIARSLTGIVQFGIWPALLKVLTEYICPKHRRKAMYLMPLGISTGNVLSYLIASIVLKLGSWQDLFTFTYVSLAVITFMYFITVAYSEKRTTAIVPKEKETVTESKESNSLSTFKIILSSGAIFVFIVAFFRSMVAQGLGNWMPTMIMESYNASPSISSVLTAIATCSNFVAVVWVMLLYPKVIKNEVLFVGIFMLLCLPLLVIMIFIGKIPLIVTVILIVFINMFKQAIHQFFTVEIPKGFTKYNKSGMIAGLINVGACLGSMLAGTIYGFTADKFGWNATVGLWAVFVLISVIAAFIAVPIWKKFLSK